MQNFIDVFHAITGFGLSVVSILLIVAILIFIGIAKNKERKQNPFRSFIQIFPDLYHLGGVKFILVITIIGFLCINTIFQLIFGKNEIGAVYENYNYSQSYEAYLYKDEKNQNDSLFCIIDISRESESGTSEDRGYSTYTIKAIHLPNADEEIDKEYDTDGKNYIYIEDDDISYYDGEYYLRLGRVANEDSYRRMEQEALGSPEYTPTITASEQTGLQDLPSGALTQTDGFGNLTDDTKQNLIELIDNLATSYMNYGYSFDAQKTNANEAIINYIIGIGLYVYYFGDNYEEYWFAEDDQDLKCDPGHQYVDKAYIQNYSANSIDWILLNIMHLQPDHQAKAYTIDSWAIQSVYYYNPNYYVSSCAAGLNSLQCTLKKIKETDSKNHIFDVTIHYIEYEDDASTDTPEGTL